MTETLLGILIVLQIADYLTTIRVIRQGGNENSRLALVKVFSRSIAAVVIYYLGGKYASALLGGGCVLYAWIVVDNFRQIK